MTNSSEEKNSGFGAKASDHRNLFFGLWNWISNVEMFYNKWCCSHLFKTESHSANTL